MILVIFSYQRFEQQRHNIKAHYSPVNRKSTPILFNENEAFDTSVHTVYSDRPMPNYEETFF